MFRKSVSFSIILSFFLISAVPTFAKPKGTWDDVKSLAGQEIAVKDKSGSVIYGILRDADDTKITLQRAGKKSLANINSTFPKDHVKKVWRASLFTGKRRTGTGALIGAGVGAGAATIYAQSDSAKGDGQAGIAIGFLVVAGAGLGAFGGFFAKKKHKKLELVYKP